LFTSSRMHVPFCLEMEGSKSMSKRRVLIAEKGPAEYTLRPDVDSVWITVDKFSVYVRRTDEGVVVDIFALDHENEEALASTYAFTQEALDAMEDLELELEEDSNAG
jgi:hypothetical protein